MDVPASVLGQLGLKIQHSLRAFTAIDRTVIKQTAQNYPLTDFYKTEDLITQLGIGEALVTLLNEKGIPTPLAHVMMCTPRSRMDVLTEGEIDNIVSKSRLVAKYNQVIDSQSAYEILTAKLEEAAEKTAEETKSKSNVILGSTLEVDSNKSNIKKAAGDLDEAGNNSKSIINNKSKPIENAFEKIANNPIVKSMMRQAGTIIVRSLLGTLGMGGRSRKSTKGWFGIMDGGEKKSAAAKADNKEHDKT